MMAWQIFGPKTQTHILHKSQSYANKPIPHRKTFFSSSFYSIWNHKITNNILTPNLKI